jgi:hypothetical protein
MLTTIYEQILAVAGLHNGPTHEAAGITPRAQYKPRRLSEFALAVDRSILDVLEPPRGPERFVVQLAISRELLRW